MGQSEVQNRSKATHSREASTGSTVSSSSSTASEIGSSVSGDSGWESSAPYGKMTVKQELSLDPRALTQDTAGCDETVEELQAALAETRAELARTKAEVDRLGRIRDDVEAEVRELTASLFQEAHAMVREANLKAAAAEKALKESQMQVDVLQAEVNALKLLVITSTPSKPNAHLHPQLTHTNSTGNSSSPPKTSGLKIFTRHRRGASDCDLKYTIPAAAKPEPEPVPEVKTHAVVSDAPFEVDPVFYGEFLVWRGAANLTRSSAFMERVFQEDADLCLDFPNVDLSLKVRNAVLHNTVYIEQVAEKESAAANKCALLNTTRVCRYRVKMGDEKEWHYISQMCRNRITAVCDFLSYLRYIQLGLVKASPEDSYLEILRLRKQMTLARLGLA